MIRDIKAIFEEQEEDYYKCRRLSNFCNNDYVEYEINGNKNRNLSPDKYLLKIKSFFQQYIN